MPIRTIFMGTGEIGLPAFRLLQGRSEFEIVAVVTQPDRPAGRNRELKASSIKLAAMELSLPVFQPESLRNGEAADALIRLQPDLIVVMAYGQILPRSILNLPTIACLNLHASLLPRHRGASPISAAIAKGDPETGVCVMHMAAGLDTGDVVLSESIPIRRRETAGSLHDRLAATAAMALSRALPLILERRLPRHPQDDSLATHVGRLDREDARIDWNRSACEIERFIRAMNPWPIAWTSIQVGEEDRKEIKVFSAIVCRKVRGQPGEVLRSDSRGILVGAANGAVLLREVQMEGRKRMPAGTWQLGTPPVLGSIAGV
jgi:methionyl-tRNA formyltransferase